MITPEHIDVEPVEAEISDQAIEALARLLVDEALREETAAEAA